jgi:hypothetical protein
MIFSYFNSKHELHFKQEFSSMFLDRLYSRLFTLVIGAAIFTVASLVSNTAFWAVSTGVMVAVIHHRMPSRHMQRAAVWSRSRKLLEKYLKSANQ